VVKMKLLQIAERLLVEFRRVRSEQTLEEVEV
jgi:hypothetical protein